MVVVVTQDMLNSQLRTCPDGSQRASYLPCPPPPAPAPAPAPAPGPNPSPGSVPGSAPGQYCSSRGCWGTGTVFTTEAQLNQALDANQAAAEAAANNSTDTGEGGGTLTTTNESSNDTSSEDTTNETSDDTSSDDTLFDLLKKDSLIKTVPNWIYLVVLLVSSCMSSLLFVVLLASR